MPRITRVQRAQKPPGNCRKCGAKIKKGDAYKWWKFRYGGKVVWCAACSDPRQSDLTTSEKLSRVYAAQESVEDAVDAFRKSGNREPLQEAVSIAADELREASEEYTESAESIRESFSESQTADECDEKADALESAASQLNMCEIPRYDGTSDKERAAWVEAVADEVDSAANEISAF